MRQYIEMGRGMWRRNPFCIVVLLSSIELQNRKAEPVCADGAFVYFECLGRIADCVVVW